MIEVAKRKSKKMKKWRQADTKINTNRQFYNQKKQKRHEMNKIYTEQKIKKEKRK